MSYRTYYSLSVEDTPEEEQLALIAKLRGSCEDAEYAFNSEGLPEDDCSWYEHEGDLRAFSKLHPDKVFCLYGDGEDSNDQWYLYVKDGKAQLCAGEMIFPEYNPDKLE